MTAAPWLFALAPGATRRVRLVEPLPPSTVVELVPGSAGTYRQHDPDGTEPARAVVLGLLDDDGCDAIAIVRDAALLGPLLNSGRGVEVLTRADLEFVGFRFAL